MTALATAIVLLVFGPPLIIGLALLVLLGIGVFSDGPQAVRKTFRCPLRARRVTAEFVVPVGAARPCSVVSCTAFKDPNRITCAKPCLGLAEVYWTPPRGVFARWALTSGGLVGPNGGEGSSPETVRAAA